MHDKPRTRRPTASPAQVIYHIPDRSARTRSQRASTLPPPPPPQTTLPTATAATLPLAFTALPTHPILTLALLFSPHHVSALSHSSPFPNPSLPPNPLAASTPRRYASLDKLSDRLGRVLRKYKDRKNSKRSAVRTSAISEAMDDVDDENDDENDAAIDIATDAASASSSVPLPETPWTLVRKKTFPMPPISVEEALLCLEYIDHDFYVFRNKESNEINVVYKREGSGVGLIEPEQ
uniref:Sigma 54 modulation/S30EA ribosomal protein C-terminal domain-containing protein n=1 Tax=Chrysotila carterae TaxID=13221 RepID=A0A6S9X0R3_CHRCT|mmetsp:Transcript_17243/g.37025  ORF Transcript_17243/g.37025 Transcript_17243/m.37025 type:complete len:236 (-) Transcript_17243:782-1489(-)